MTRNGELITPECKGCALINYNNHTCRAFVDPSFQFRNGHCFGRCDSIDSMIERLEAMVRVGGTSNSALVKELKEWRETKKALEEGWPA